MEINSVFRPGVTTWRGQARNTRPKKRALLIGIQCLPPEKLAVTTKAGKLKEKVAQKLGKRWQDSREEVQKIHRDTSSLKQTLIELYGYLESDITLLMDVDDPDWALPTEANILKYIDELVAGAASGDTFFFYFSGHSKQEETDNNEKEDGNDHFIVTFDDKYIRDDVLREKLVNPLPVGSHLIVVLDTCRSASLLNLKHFRCNRVWVPWTNKGKRRSMEMQNAIVRKQGVLPKPKRQRRKSSSDYMEQVFESPAQKSMSRRIGERPHSVNPDTCSDNSKTPALPPPKSRTSSGQSNESTWLGCIAEGFPIVRCDSPEELYCSGWCAQVPDAETKFPKVISLSAAKTGERVWEDSESGSMTQFLLRTLHKDPNPTLHDLLLAISHETHESYLDIHAKSQDYKRKVRTANLRRLAKGLLAKTPALVEMDNFQNPQISSLYPLDIKNQRWTP